MREEELTKLWGQSRHLKAFSGWLYRTVFVPSRGIFPDLGRGRPAGGGIADGVDVEGSACLDPFPFEAADVDDLDRAGAFGRGSDLGRLPAMREEGEGRRKGPSEI